MVLWLALPLTLSLACFESSPSGTSSSPDPITGVAPELPAEVASGTPAAQSSAAQSSAASPLQAEMLARPLDITRHGACRMDCRKVDQDEALTVLRQGELIEERTRTDGPCPSHAFEGTGTDGHRLRVVFAECRDETRLITAIDLDEDWPCDCD